MVAVKNKNKKKSFSNFHQKEEEKRGHCGLGSEENQHCNKNGNKWIFGMCKQPYAVILQPPAYMLNLSVLQRVMFGSKSHTNFQVNLSFLLNDLYSSLSISNKLCQFTFMELVRILGFEMSRKEKKSLFVT